MRAEIERTKAELKTAAEKVQSIQRNISEREKPKSELFKIQSAIGKLETEIERLKMKFEPKNAEIIELREEYKQIFCSKGGMCPTCEQDLPIEKFKEIKDKKIAEIETQGKQLKIECEKLASEISSKENELEIFKRQAEKNSIAIESFASMEELNAAIAERDKIIAQKTDATNKLARFLQNRDDAEKTQKRIEELKKLEKEINQNIADIERQINLAEKFIRAKVKMIEEAVNSKFEFVKFKAALDILRTLQKFYSIELPNQIFLLKVSEGKLKIDVEEKIELKIEGEKAA